MAEERIDVQVTDKVDSGIAQKFNQMAEGAERAESYIKRLKAALANINESSIDRLAAAMAKADAATAKMLSAQARLTNAQNQGSIAASKMALAEQKIATEAARTEAAQQRAAAATIGAESAALRLAAAQNRLAGSSNAAASATQNSATAAGQAGAAYGSAAAGANRFAQAGGAAAATATRFGAASNTVATGYGNQVNAANQYARAARQTTAVNANIIAQMQDIGVSLAGGQNPLLVMIQQGSQLSYIASTMQGGWTKIFGVMGMMLLRFSPLIALIGALTLALKGLQTEADKGMDKYIQSLGLTEKEVRKLKDTHVTMGDTIKATWQVLSADLLASMGLTTAEFVGYWEKAKNIIVTTMKVLAVIIYAIVATLVQNIGKAVYNIVAIFNNAGIMAAKLFLKSIEFLVNKTIDGVNAIGDTINALSGAAGFGDLVGNLEHVDLGVNKLGGSMMELQAMNPLKDLGDNAVKADKYLTDAGKRITEQARKNAEARLKEQADLIKLNRGAGPKGKEDHTAENRAHAIEMVNMKLDDELQRMKLLKDERAIAQRMDQIEESLAQKKIILNAAEKKSIEEKVRAIELYKYQQAEMDRIYESVVGPMRTYQAALAAIADLEERGAITSARAGQERVKAARTLAEATDPLFNLKEALTTAEAALHKYGVEAQRAAYYEQIRQEMLTHGITLSPQYVAGINAETDALMRRNDALLQQQFIQSQISGIVDPILENQRIIDSKEQLYAELDRMANAHEITEKQRIQARYALQARLDETRLQQASQFFGNLATLSSSGNKKLALIGKAAAVAQATIDGVMAVQKALASAPPPLNFALAAAAGVAAAVNVAKIVSTPVGNYATGGQFMVGGKDGIDANNINMNVTKGERVTVETAAQQRANDNAQTPAQTPDVKVRVVNVTNPRDLVSALQTTEGEHEVLNIISNNPDVLRRVLG